MKQLFLKDGKWYGGEFPEVLICKGYICACETPCEKAVEKLKSEALEVKNPEVYPRLKRFDGVWCFTGNPNEVIEPGVLYPWDGGWEIIEVPEYPIDHTSYPPMKKVLRLLPKSPVIPEGLKGSGDDYPVVDHPHHRAPTVKTYVPQGGIVATGREEPEQAKDEWVCHPEVKNDAIAYFADDETLMFYDHFYRKGLESVEPSPQAESREVWDEMLNYCEEHHISDVRVLEYLMKHYSLTRKP